MAFSYDLVEGNGGNATSGSANVDTNFTTATAPNRVGYTFTGWKINNAGDTLTANTSVVMPATDSATITIVAQWSANSYTVNYFYNNATGGNETATVVFTTGETAITLPTPTRTGYDFGGWYANPGLTGASLSSPYSPTGETLTVAVYAKWNVTGFDVIFVEQGGAEVANATYNAIVRSVTLPSVTRSGFNLRGWYTAAIGGTRIGGAGTNYSIPAQISGNVTYYAQWTVGTFSVSFNNNGSNSGSVPSLQSGAFNTSQTIRANTGNLARTGYTFGGWSTGRDGSGDTYTAGSSLYTFPGQNVTLFAIWIPNPVTITFLGNGGSGSMSAQSTFSGLRTLNANAFGLPGGASAFGGWSLTPGGARVDVANQITLTGNITLYARWL